jgi:DNA-binding PadR family transcriptional regulator
MAETRASPASPHGLIPASDLEERERSVLAELAREVDAWVTFQGLRRQLGVHQQALTRTLRRLASEGLVAHDGKGYQLTDRGAQALRGVAFAPPSGKPLQVLEAMLPPYLSAGDVAAHLSRRWFGGLRWYAQSEGPGESVLHWMTENGKGRISVRVHGAGLTLEVSPDPDDPTGGFGAVRPVLAALAELYGPSAQKVDPLGYRSSNGFPLT